MIQKNDLAKKFELVVQQEIKNYNDSLNNLLQSIRDVRIEIESMKKGMLSSQVSSESGRQDLASQIQRMTESNDIELAKLRSALNDLLSLHRELVNQITIQQDVGAQNAIKNEFNRNSIDRLYGTVKCIEDEIVGNSLRITHQLEGIKFRLSKDFQKFKEEILSMPSEAFQVKKDLEEKLSIQAIDFDGVMRELAVFKKENMITQKKIENIYTLIERFQNKDQSI